MKYPFFSIVLPVYNCEKTIVQTLDSVLSQTFTDYEIIIIDDCSTDNTLKIVESYKNNYNINILKNDKNLGVSISRNKGFDIAKGYYIAFIDGDDIWLTNKLEKQFSIIKNTDCDICCTSYGFIDENSHEIKRPYIIPELIDYPMLLKENYIGCSSVVIKKSLLSCTSMNSDYQHEDYALWLILARNRAKIIGIREPLMKYRISKNSRSFNKSKAAKGRMMIYLKQENLNIFTSLYYFSHYTINGVKKRFL